MVSGYAPFMRLHPALPSPAPAAGASVPRKAKKSQLI